MKLATYVVYAQRELPGGLITRVTKAIEEEMPVDAMVEFCNIIGVSPQLLDRPELMGTKGWNVVIVHVTRSKFRTAVSMFNRDPF